MRRILVFVFSLALSGQALAGLQEADQAVAAKDYSAAIAAYLEVLSTEPDNLTALRGLGAAYYNSDDKGRSLGAYEAAIAKKPDDADAQRFVDALKSRGVTAIPYEAPALKAPASAAKRQKYGVRAGFGFGLPTGVTALGTDESTGGAYSFGMGGGLTTGGEFLWSFHPQLELGIGLQFIGNVASFSSKDYSGALENSYKVDSSVTPIDLTLYAMIPQTERLSWVLGFGPALALAADYDAVEESKGGGGTTTKTVTEVSFDIGLGYHGLLGVEYKFSPRFSVLAGVDLEAIELSKSKEAGTRVGTDPVGTLVTNESFEYEYVTSPPKRKAPTTTVSGSVTTTDDGVEVTTYDSSTGKQTSKKKLAKTSTVNFGRIAPFVRATVRF